MYLEILRDLTETRESKKNSCSRLGDENKFFGEFISHFDFLPLARGQTTR